MTIRSHRRYSLGAADGLELPVYLLEFDLAGFSPEAFAASGIVCPASVARSVHKRQAEFYFGRLAARMALSQVVSVPNPVAIGASREPLWPAGIIGSISHNQNFAAATALQCGARSGVGIDIERIVVSEETQAALRATAIGDDEVAYLRTLTTALPLNVLMTLVFSAKESLFKGAFAAVGRYFDFSAARTVHIDPVQGRVSLALTQTLCDTFVRDQTCEVGFDFIKTDTVLTYFAW